MITTPSLSLPNALLAEISDFIETRFGLLFPRERWRDLDRNIAAASQALGFDNPQRFSEKLLTGRATTHEIGYLASRLTIGETYFFRDPRILDVFETNILPTLKGRPPRIWSAGCATGEEACSIAILIARQRLSKDAFILATDISTEALSRARAGIYGEWSFRATPSPMRERYFYPTGYRRWEINPEIRNMITFAQANLAEPPLPAARAMDVVFCRNVLMYFSREAVQRAARFLHDSLKNGGWLIVSPAEIAHGLFAQFSPVQLDGVTLYRKDSRRITASAWTASGPTGSLSDDVVGTRQSEPVDGESATSKRPPGLRNRVPAMLRLARWYANHGDLPKALRWCEKAIASGVADFRAHYLLAAILEELGDQHQAARSLRRALYLEPSFVIGHFHLARLTERQGKTKEASRHLANTLHLLRAREDNEILPESGGLTAGRVRELIARRKNA